MLVAFEKQTTTAELIKTLFLFFFGVDDFL